MFLFHFPVAMKINSTASYAPSYTANYGDAQAAQRKAMTKVQVKTDPAEDQAANAVQQFKVRSAGSKQAGTFLNAKA